ncbi:MAG: GNVR domain-containing protein, partial [Fusobacteriaceae bacterium]
NMAIVMELSKEQENLKDYLANRYIELYENEVQIELKKSLDEKYSQVKTEKEKYETELKVLESEVQNLIIQQPKELLINDSIINVITMKYPIIFQKKNQMTELYLKYSNELLGIEGALKEEVDQKRIIKLTDVYKIPVKSKALLILAVGMVLGLFLGIFMAFVKEFMVGYKNKIK